MSGMTEISSETERQVVRFAAESDLQIVVSVHLAAFDGYMNTMLGRAYLRDFYRWFMHAEEGFLLVVLQEGRIVGFVAGADVGYGNRMNRDLLWSGVRGILLHPRIWIHPRFWRTVTARLAQLVRKPERQDPSVASPDGRGISLVGIAVPPEEQGAGVGKILMEAFEVEVRRRKADYVRLSVYDTNAPARRVYERQGWRLLSDSDGTLVYMKHISV